MSTTTNVPITEADENAIRALVALAQKSQSDPETLPALHTAETVIVNLAGRRVLGRESYAKAMADGLACHRQKPRRVAHRPRTDDSNPGSADRR